MGEEFSPLLSGNQCETAAELEVCRSVGIPAAAWVATCQPLIAVCSVSKLKRHLRGNSVFHLFEAFFCQSKSTDSRQPKRRVSQARNGLSPWPSNCKYSRPENQATFSPNTLLPFTCLQSSCPHLWAGSCLPWVPKSAAVTCEDKAYISKPLNFQESCRYNLAGLQGAHFK